MRLSLLYIFVALTAIGGCSRCDRDEPGPVDPCATTKPAFAKFRAFESVGPLFSDTLWDKYYDLDTLNSNGVTFTATDSTASSFTWRIGAGTYSTKSVSLKNFPAGQQIPVKLIVRKPKPSNGCLVDSQLVDSATRYIYVTTVKYRNGSLAYGRFRGYLNGNTLDTITLTYVIDSTNLFYPNGFIYTYNFIKDMSYMANDSYYFSNYRFSSFGSDECYSQTISDTICYGLRGSIHINRNGTVQARYWVRRKTFQHNPFKLHSDTTRLFNFIGHRIAF